MADRNINEITISQADRGECSDPTVEIKIRTLDSQSYTLRVNKCVPVPALKEQIATVTGVLSEQQRLICRGKVLKDEQLLSAYHVEDGHTLHLVVRQPLQQPTPSMTRTSVTNGNAEPQGSDPLPGAIPSSSGQVSRMVLGTFNIADQGVESIPDLNRQGIGFETQERVTTRSLTPEANQTQFDNVSDVQFDPNHGSFRFSPFLYSRRFNQPVAISDSLTTLSQYLNRIGHEFALNGSESQPRSTTSQSSDADALGAASDLLSVAGSLPTPATLGMVIRCTQQLLTSHFGSSLSQLARHLEGEASITDPEARSEIQSVAMRNGIMMQNMGALLLELGRTTMRLRMRESSAESVVNAGPAVFVSTTGLNPLMVQALPFQTGSSFGAIPVGATQSAASVTTGSISAGDVLRNININIRTGSPLAPSSNSEQWERVSVQQVDGQGNQVGSAQGGTFSRHDVSSVLGESGALRVVPVRTVVAAVPEAINGRSPTESSGNSVGVFYPLLGQFQQLNPLQLIQIRGAPQTPDTESHSSGAGTVHAPSSVPLPTSRAQVQVQSSISTAIQNVRIQEQEEPLNSLVNMTLAGQIQNLLNGAPQSNGGSIVEEHISQQAPSSLHVYDIHFSPRNMQEDHEGGRAVSGGNPIAHLPSGIDHIFSGTVPERHSGTLGGDIVRMMYEMLHNSARIDISRPAAFQVGAPSGSTNVIEQTMQNSFWSNQLQMTQQMGERNQLLQRLMPSISQVTGRECEVSTSHHGTETQPMASSSEGLSSSYCGSALLKTSIEGQSSSEKNDTENSMNQGDMDSGVDGYIHSDAERQQADPSDDGYPESSRASKRQRTQ